MNILLLNPPFLPRFSREQRSPGVTKSGTFYYPMWLAYATGAFEKAGYTCQLVDAVADELTTKNVIERAWQHPPKLIIISTATPSIYSDVNVAEQLKNAFPDAKTLLVGPHVSALSKETLTLSTTVDAAARGEYELIALELADAIAHQRSWKNIAGLTWRSGQEIIENPGMNLPHNLDALPFVSSVYKKHLNIHKYRYSSCRHPLIVFNSSRGCANQCIFCVYIQVFSMRTVRTRSVENVIEEIRYIKRELPDVQEIMFEDDTFTSDPRRMKEFCEQMIREKINMTWSANARVHVSMETLQLMKRAGCRLLCVGIESGDEEILRNIKKGITVDHIRTFMKNARKAGVLVHGCFMFGHPGDTRETMRKTVDLAKEINPDSAQFFPVMAYPGTEFYEWAKANHYLMTENFRDWNSQEGSHNSVVSRPGLTAEDLVSFADQARREFYLRPKYLSMKFSQVLKHPSEFSRNFQAFMTLRRYL